MSGKSQTIRDYTDHPRFRRFIGYSLEFCPRFWRDAMFICDWGAGAQQIMGLVMSKIQRWRTRTCPTAQIWVFTCQEWSPGRVRKIETLPILQICPRSSQMIGDIYDFEFPLVGKIWDEPETVKSNTIRDFPDIWKPGLSECLYKVICMAQEVITYFREAIWSRGGWVRLERHLKGISDRYSVKVAISYSTTHATRKQHEWMNEWMNEWSVYFNSAHRVFAIKSWMKAR